MGHTETKILDSTFYLENTCHLQKWGKNETILGHKKLRSGGPAPPNHGVGKSCENLGETPCSGVHKIHAGQHNLTFIVHFKLK